MKKFLKQILYMLIVMQLVVMLREWGYGLREVRERGRIVFYNEKGLKVKSYYLRNNRVVYVNRYYYSGHLCVKKATLRGRKVLSVYLYEYHKESEQISLKKYYYKNKFKYLIRYDINGIEIERSNKDDQEIEKKEVLEGKHSSDGAGGGSVRVKEVRVKEAGAKAKGEGEEEERGEEGEKGGGEKEEERGG